MSLDQARERGHEHLALFFRERVEDVAVHAVHDPRPLGIRARRSVLDGRRSASPALSRSSTVTTMVVLSRSEISASSIWVRSASSAWNSTQNPRGVSPISAVAAAIWVASTWLAWDNR